MLEVRGLHVGERLRPVSLSVSPGSLLAIVGPNGAGKSTLIRAMLGLEPVSGGDVVVDGVSVLGMGSRVRAAYLGWLPQQSGRADGMSALEVVSAARYRFRESRRASETAAAAALDQAGVGALSSRRLSTLSGGERQRVRLAGLIAQEADYWMLDEPGNHLDPAAQLDVWQGLVEQCQAGRGVVVVTHDVTLLGFVEGVTARILALESGESPWCLGVDSQELPARLSALLDLDLRRVEIDGVARLLIAGRSS